MQGQRNLHSALKTEIVDQTMQNHLRIAKVKMQWGKEDIAFSLHVEPNQYTSYGMQTTDYLAYLGFTRNQCAFSQKGEAYCRWTTEEFDINMFSGKFFDSFKHLEESQKHFEACGYLLPQPEGWGYFNGRPSGRSYNSSQHYTGNGHTSPKTEQMKQSSDEYFEYAFTWIEGGNAKGWTTHYRPKHLPLSHEIKSVLSFIKLNEFPSCPEFDFESCFWRFTPFESRGSSLFDSNAESAHRYFDAHANSFAKGIESILAAHSIMLELDINFLPQTVKPHKRTIEIPKAKSHEPMVSKAVEQIEDTYDVAITFAGTERDYAEKLATLIRDAGHKVFYDQFYPEQLWGKNLVDFFDKIYHKNSRYCVMLISEEYVKRMWTNHERQSAQARALEEKGKEYILPIRFDSTELPGMQPTIGYLSAKDQTIEQVVAMLADKLKRRK